MHEGILYPQGTLFRRYVQHTGVGSHSTSSHTRVFLGPQERTSRVGGLRFCVYCSYITHNNSSIRSRRHYLAATIMADNGGMMNVIRCDLKEYIVWKWRPQFNDSNDPGQRSNFVRWGSSLRVKDGEMAVFVYRGANKEGYDSQDFIMGPYDGTIETANLPVISKIIGLAYGGGQGGPFQAEVYFINLQGNNQILFGIPFFDVFDSRYPDLAVPVSTRGTITFNLTDYKSFIKLNRLTDFNMMDFKNQIRSALTKYMKHVIINMAGDKDMSVIRIESKILEISETASKYISKRFSDDFGVNLKALDIEAVSLNKDSEGYKQLKGLTFGIVSRTTQAQADANIRNMEQMQEWNSENVRATMAIQRGEMQRAQRLQTETAYMGAHALDQQTEVGKQFASAMGQSGAMNVGGSQMNPAGMMTGMMMGGAMGQQMAGMMNQMGQTVNQNLQQANQMPPQVPQMNFYVLIAGQQTGPHNTTQLSQLIASGQLTPDSYVWKAGMASWDYAKNTEVNTLFPVAPPTPPAPPAPPTPPVINS